MGAGEGRAIGPRDRAGASRGLKGNETYRVQASYRLDTGTRFHAAAGSGVKSPSFGDLFDFFAGRYIGNPDLKPEKSQAGRPASSNRFWTIMRRSVRPISTITSRTR